MNTASGCGFTSQFTELETLHQEFKNEGLVVLGFPSNDFLGQEPLDSQGIKHFCELNQVNFRLFEKASVRGKNKQPVYKFLTEQGAWKTNGPVFWNFEKFLVDKTGKTRYRFRSWTKPQSLKVKAKIYELLSESK